MKITNFWIAQYPQRYSTLDDIFHEQPAETLHQWIRRRVGRPRPCRRSRAGHHLLHGPREGPRRCRRAPRRAEAGIDAADSDYRAGTLSELEAPSDEPCPARGDDGVCQPGHPEDVSACMHCCDPVALDAPIEGALELPEYVAPRHRAGGCAGVRARVQPADAGAPRLRGGVTTELRARLGYRRFRRPIRLPGDRVRIPPSLSMRSSTVEVATRTAQRSPSG